MQYKYAKDGQDYSDYSSGRVLYSLPGHPAFPVRLASEIFQRCLAHRLTLYGSSTPCTLYDPCCGAAYHLTLLGYLHGENIREVIGSDVDETAVRLAERNLGLLHRDGLDRRIREISELLEKYVKESHREALQSAFVLKGKLSPRSEGLSITTRSFQANATHRAEILSHIPPMSVDIVFTDIPYGQHSQWRGINLIASPAPLASMLDALLPVLSPSSIVAISSDKQQKAVHERYGRIEQFQIGKRRVVILQPISK